MTKRQFVRNERQFSYDFLSKLESKKWQAKTLCKGWSIEDLAAHLVTRERNIIGGIGLVIPGLHWLHDKRLEKVKKKGHEYILKKLSHYPWWMPVSFNTGEFWVHNEDMLRGDLNIKRETPHGEAGEILWNSLNGLVRVKSDLVQDLGNVTLENSDTSAVIIIKNKQSMKDTAISASPGELLLFFYGRRKAARVKISD